MRHRQIENPTPIEFVVSGNDAKLRLDQFLAKRLPEYSRSRLQQLIRSGFVRLNEQATRPRQIVRRGDKIDLREPPLEKIDVRPEPIPLEILFEDDDLIVINKPAGLTVHPGAGQRDHTLVNALLSHCATLSGIGGKERPGIVHRLDKETSGCLVVAKNDMAHRELSKQFAARTVEKIYLALVAGKLRKPASLIECRLHSGRTHQIRVHLHHLGHPVVGDKIYAPRFAKNFARQMLHAWKLGFRHPRTGEWKHFEAPLPADFATAIKADNRILASK